ncbi:MAG: hypothetical protein ACOCP8_01465 [archaeon]
MPDNYMDIVNKYKNSIEGEKPVYNYSRDYVDGGVEISTKKNVEKIITKKDIENFSREQLQQILNKTNENIMKNEIEAKVHQKLLESNLDNNLSKVYELKFESYLKEVEYLKTKKVVLETMLQK